MKNTIEEATTFANGLCQMLGKGSAMMTQLAALGMGSDVSLKIKTGMEQLEKHYMAINKLTKEDVTDVYKYKRDMDWGLHYYKVLKVNIGVGAAMIGASMPKKRPNKDLIGNGGIFLFELRARLSNSRPTEEFPDLSPPDPRPTF